MDVLQFASIGIFSKILGNVLEHSQYNNYIIGLFIFLGLARMVFSIEYVSIMLNKTISVFFEKEESAMELRTHTKKTMGDYGSNALKYYYSERFQALVYFLENMDMNNSTNAISKFVEIIKINNSFPRVKSDDFMFIPESNYRTKIYEKFQGKYDIFLEVKNNTPVSIDESGEKKKSCEDNSKITTFYLIVKGKHNFKVLHAFMDTLMESHTKEINKKKSHQLYELIGTSKNENSGSELIYREFPFKSNKFLDKNIFFEGRKEFIEYIDYFSTEKDHKKDIYSISGITKKACILLSGPPGCGKSCIIKGILNRTGRDGIIVPWTRLKRCSDFISLFRSKKINDTLFDMKNYVFIFEDFDANNSETLKKRKANLKNTEKHDELLAASQLLAGKNNGNNDSENDGENEDEKKENTLVSMLSSMNKKMDDELTLECVLTTLDGIAEMQDAILIFTTNHLDKIDPAFYRSGRVDYRLDMKLASVNIIQQMVCTYRQITRSWMYKKKFEKMKSYKISTADVQSICFKYRNKKIERCLDELIIRTNKQ
uniref:ATPase AAA-type core domain-containing protein n=1 Tax=viral metagenome TaxID=1070528 RepID=A0A6C0LBF1_9ZZZZ